MKVSLSKAICRTKVPIFLYARQFGGGHKVCWGKAKVTCLFEKSTWTYSKNKELYHMVPFCPSDLKACSCHWLGLKFIGLLPVWQQFYFSPSIITAGCHGTCCDARCQIIVAIDWWHHRSHLQNGCWGEGWTLWNQKPRKCHFWNPALSIWPHSEFRARPLSSSLENGAVNVCICALAQGLELGRESLCTKKRGRFIPNYSFIDYHYWLLSAFWNFSEHVFQSTLLPVTPGVCWTTFRSLCDITVKYLDIWFSFFFTFYWVPRVSAGVCKLWTASSKPVSELLQLANGPCNVFPQRYHYSAFHMAAVLINKLWNAFKSGEKLAGMKCSAFS